MGNAFLPTFLIYKWWANDKAVCPPYAKPQTSLTLRRVYDCQIFHIDKFASILSMILKRLFFQIYTAEEFIAAITQHIPEKSFQMVRYSIKTWKSVFVTFNSAVVASFLPNIRCFQIPLNLRAFSDNIFLTLSETNSHTK